MTNIIVTGIAKIQISVTCVYSQWRILVTGIAKIQISVASVYSQWRILESQV